MAEIDLVAGLIVGGESPIAEELCVMMNDDTDALLVCDTEESLLEPVRHLASPFICGLGRCAADFNSRRRSPVAEDNVDFSQATAKVGVKGAESVSQLVLLLGQAKRSRTRRPDKVSTLWLKRSRQGE